MDEAQTMGESCIRAVDRDGMAFNGDVGLIGRDDSGEDLDERRLARAVLPHQRMNFTGRDLERNRAQRRRAVIGLGDIGERQEAHRARAK